MGILRADRIWFRWFKCHQMDLYFLMEIDVSGDYLSFADLVILEHI